MDRDATAQCYVTRDGLGTQRRAATRQGCWQVTDALDVNRRSPDSLARATTHNEGRRNIRLDNSRRGGDRGGHRRLRGLLLLANPGTDFGPAVRGAEVSLLRSEPVPA